MIHGQFNLSISAKDVYNDKHGRPDFLKIDVEGHEEAVFAGLSHAIPLVSFEANLPDFAQETCRVALHLEKLAPGTRFAVCGSGVKFAFTFPLSCNDLCHLVQDIKVPPYLEIFAKNPLNVR